MNTFISWVSLPEQPVLARSYNFLEQILVKLYNTIKLDHEHNVTSSENGLNTDRIAVMFNCQQKKMALLYTSIHPNTIYTIFSSFYLVRGFLLSSATPIMKSSLNIIKKMWMKIIQTTSVAHSYNCQRDC